MSNNLNDGLKFKFNFKFFIYNIQFRTLHNLKKRNK